VIPVPVTSIPQTRDFSIISIVTLLFDIVHSSDLPVISIDIYIENNNNRPCNQVDQHLGNKKEEVDKWYDIIEDQSMMNSMT